MKNIKWRVLILTCLVCVLPVLLGVALWDNLPERIPIHFNINNEPDNFASKGFAVFGLPFIMALIQMFCCVISDIQAGVHVGNKKFDTVSKWIIPVMCVVLYVVTLGYALGWKVDIRRIAMLIVGTEFIVIGNYLPKADYIKDFKNKRIYGKNAKKINRAMGFMMVILGFLGLTTIFLPSIASVIWLILLIPCVATAAVCSIIFIRKSEKEQ